MIRLPLACVLALAVGSAALAQSTGDSATTSSKATTKTKTGIAKPPAGTTAPAPEKFNPNDNSAIGANVPTLPQIALHPQATIGSGVPIAGPGGSTATPVGN